MLDENHSTRRSTADSSTGSIPRSVISSRFEHFEYKKVAPLFAKLARNFESCVYGLNQVKNDLQERQHPIIRQTSELLM